MQKQIRKFDFNRKLGEGGFLFFGKNMDSERPIWRHSERIHNKIFNFEESLDFELEKHMVSLLTNHSPDFNKIDTTIKIGYWKHFDITWNKVEKRLGEKQRDVCMVLQMRGGEFTELLFVNHKTGERKRIVGLADALTIIEEHLKVRKDEFIGLFQHPTFPEEQKSYLKGLLEFRTVTEDEPKAL